MLNATLAPFIFGNLSLQNSVADTASIYPEGSTAAYPPDFNVHKSLDPWAAAYEFEPDLILDRSLVERDRTVPLWNPYNAFGTPLAADGQSQPYSPFAWIAIAWPGPTGYDLLLLLRIFVGAAFAFLYFRRFVPRIASLIGATTFGYATYFWAYLAMPEVSVEMFLPAIFLAVEMVLERPTIRSVLFFAFSLTSCVSGGMPECIFLAISWAALYAIFRFSVSETFRKKWRSLLTAVVSAATLSLGLSAILLLPLFEFISLSFNVHTIGSQTPFGAKTDGFSLIGLATYLAPLVHGPPWNNVFTGFAGYAGMRGGFGAAAIFFALISVIGLVRRSAANNAMSLTAAFFAVSAILIGCKRFGFLGLPALGYLPILRLIDFGKYEEAELALAIGALAAFGSARVFERRSDRLEKSAAAIFALLPLAFLAMQDHDAAQTLSGEASYYYGSMALALGSLGIVYALSCFEFSTSKSRRALASLALLTVFVEVNVSYIVPMFYFADTPGMKSAAPQMTAAHTPYLEYVKRALSGQERFYAEDALLIPNWSAAFSIYDVRSLNALYDSRYLPFVRAFLSTGPGDRGDLGDRFIGTASIDFSQPLALRFLALSSVRYVAAQSPLHLRPVFHEAHTTVYRVSDILPRVSIFSRVMAVDDAQSALSAITSPKFDEHSEAVAESDFPELRTLANQPGLPVRAAAITCYDSRNVCATVAASKTSFVVLNDTFFPGWHAYVDDVETPVQRANYLFRGIAVPPGTHRIRFVYEPRSFLVGASITLVALLVSVVAFCYSVIRKRPDAGGESAA